MPRRLRIPMTDDIIRRLKRQIVLQLEALEGAPPPEPDDTFRGTATRRHLRAMRREGHNDAQPTGVIPAKAGTQP